MKIGVSSYSFNQYYKNGKLTPFEAIAKAKELGFEAMEFTESDLKPPEGITQTEFAKQVKAEAERVGIALSALVVGANLAKKDVSEEVKRIKALVDVANTLGVTLFRHDTMWDYAEFRSFDLALPTIAKATREITEYAARFGIKTMVENHGFIGQDSDRLERLVTAVNHDNFGLLLDIGNFLCADEAPEYAVSKLANLAFLVHAKDFDKVCFSEAKNPEGYFQTRGCNNLKGVAVGEGAVPVSQCVAILKRAGFDGYIDIEFEGTEDCIEGLQYGFSFLRKCI